MTLLPHAQDGAAPIPGRRPASGGLGARLTALVLRPADEVAAERAAKARTGDRTRRAAEGPRLAVLVPAGAGDAVGEAVALAVARRAGADVAVLATTGSAGPGRGSQDGEPLVRPAARRTTAALRAHGLEARAARVVRVALPADDPALRAAWQRVTVVVPRAAVVVLVRGPRTEAHDALLAEQDAVVAVVPPSAAASVAALAATDTVCVHVVGAEVDGAAAHLSGPLAHRLTPVRSVVAAAHAALAAGR